MIIKTNCFFVVAEIALELELTFLFGQAASLFGWSSSLVGEVEKILKYQKLSRAAVGRL